LGTRRVVEATFGLPIARLLAPADGHEADPPNREPLEAAEQGRVVLTVEELRVLIADTTMQAGPSLPRDTRRQQLPGRAQR
jgi:hypothetical protein